MMLEMLIVNQLSVNTASASKRLPNVNTEDIPYEIFLILNKEILIMMVRSNTIIICFEASVIWYA
jgi:hypothetical protein